MPEAGHVWFPPAITIGRAGVAVRLGEVHAPATEAASHTNIVDANNIGQGDLSDGSGDLKGTRIKSQRVQRPGVRPWGPKGGPSGL